MSFVTMTTMMMMLMRGGVVMSLMVREMDVGLICAMT